MKKQPWRVLLAAAVIATGGALVYADAAIWGTPASLAAVRSAEAGFHRAVLRSVSAEIKKQGLETFAKDMVTSLVPRGATLASVPERSGSHLLYLSRMAQGIDSRLEPGLYEVETVSDSPMLYYYDPAAGRIPGDFTPVDDDDSTMFHTPLGDDMCEKAPDLIYEFCQTFVACAAYEFC